MIRKSLIKAFLYTPGVNGFWGLPVNFISPPGGGKTSMLEQAAAEFDLPECETFALSDRGEAAVGIVPVPHVVNGVMTLVCPRPEWTTRFDKTERGLVIIDELTSVAPALQPPLMGMFLAGRIGGHTLPRGVRRLALSNPPDQAANGAALPLPLANRMGHLKWMMPTVEEHVQYMLRGAVSAARTRKLLREMDEDLGIEDPSDDAEDERDTEEDGAARFDGAAEEARVLKAWPAAWAQAVGLETAFLQAKGEMKYQMPEVGSAQAGAAWPSDRTWEMATRAYTASIIHKLSEEETEQAVEAFIGAGAASEFLSFVQEQDLPNTAHLLDGKVSFKHDTQRVDRTVAVLAGCAALVAPASAPKRIERSVGLWKLLEQLSTEKADLDLLVPCVHALIECNLAALKHSSKVLIKINPVLKAAGIVGGK